MLDHPERYWQNEILIIVHLNALMPFFESLMELNPLQPFAILKHKFLSLSVSGRYTFRPPQFLKTCEGSLRFVFRSSISNTSFSTETLKTLHLKVSSN